MENCLWTPSKSRIEKSQMTDFMNNLGVKVTKKFSSYEELHQYSINESAIFWKYLFEYFKIKFEGDLDPANTDETFNSYGWFKNVRLSFAENLLNTKFENKTAINFIHESGLSRKINYKDLNSEVLKVSQYLNQFIGEGDVVGAYMPNIPETVITMLATNAVGGTFTSTSSDFGIEGVYDRFSVSKPKIIVAAIGYEYGGKYFDQLEKIKALEERLDFVEKIIIVNFLNKEIDISKLKKTILYSDIKLSDKKIEFKRLSFSHPHYIMYSSGTTGKPKCIVHSQGGTLLQHVKELGLHTDLTSDKKIFFFTTCGWMMWNWLVSSLYFGAEVVLYEGSPAFPSPESFFNLIKKERINIFGTSPKFLKVLEDTNAKVDMNDCDFFETILSTGSPLLPEQYDYVYAKIKKDILLSSISGGTDIIGCFMLGNPILPVYQGEIQCLGLGMNVCSLGGNGEALKDMEGELVCKSSFPSRPIYFLNDQNNEKIKEAYFNQNKGYWTHGDFVKITKKGGVIVYGRSDATLNPGGVRIGTAEIYRQTESFDFVMDSLCVGRSVNGDVDIVLFIKMKENELLTVDRIKALKDKIKKNTTPRHVPKEIYAIPDIPYTRSGKKVELAVSRILAGREVSNVEALVNPESLEFFNQYKNT